MKTIWRLGLLALTLCLVGCSAAERFTSSGPSATGPGRSSNPTPTRFRGSVLLTVEGVASYYSQGFNGKLTASGEVFNKNAFTAAHREFPFGTLLRVTNLGNGKSVEVTVNDRGPFKKDRIIDLSEAAAKAIGMIGTGTAEVKIEVLKWGNNEYDSGG